MSGKSDLDGEPLGEAVVRGREQSLVQANVQVAHLCSQLAAVDGDGRPLVPQLLRSTPGESTPGPRRVQADTHALALGHELVGIATAEAIEPRPSVTVLALELAIVAGVVRRTVQDEHLVGEAHLPDQWGVVGPPAVLAQDEGWSVQCEIGVESGRDGRGVIAFRHGDAGRVGDRRVAGAEQTAETIGGRHDHGVEAPYYARGGDLDAGLGSLAFTFHGGQGPGFDDGCVTT